MDTPFMKKLNAAQLNAATCKSNSVQILAGPGSGKTRVLTSRVAWLVLSEHVRPQNIVVVTFTNKAAKEMRHRLESPELLGSMQSDKLCMGTFHSICARLLRQYHAHVQLKPNFTIADTDMSRHAIKKLKEELIGELSDYGRTKMKPEAYFNVISKARNAGMNVDQYIEKNYGEWDKKDICIMFKAYEDRMHADNLVDFDNLLLYTRVLLARFPSAANFVSHVLVDEFQDTNVVQYDIVKGLTRGGKALTIVGDPDQSIFGWRNADRGNFIKMQREFKGTQICNLEENYRSTKHILKSAFHVVSKDKKRIDKSLFTENAEGVPMSMLKMSDDTMEAQSVAEEIKRIVEYSGSLITYKDIAILVRMNYLSRAFESALNSLSIPYVVIGGVKFFERAEVKDILAYLRFCYNANDTEAFERIINRPRRGVGEVTMNKIEKLSRQPGATIISVLRDISTGKGKMIASIPLKTKQNLAGFVNLYDNVQELMQKKSYIYRILEYIIGDTNYKEFLQKEHPDKDGESRWDNVGELVTFAKQFNPPPDNLAKNSAAVTMSGIEILENEPPENESNVEDSLPDLPNYTEPTEEEPPLGDDERLNDGDHIVRFLELTTLSTNSKEEDEADLGKVTISTMHSAKGLEWPVVFTIACEAGIIPHQKAEDDMEECRLLYVAMTRPKCFLYCTSAKSRASWGEMKPGILSGFIADMPEEAYSKRTPTWDKAARTWVSSVLKLPSPEDCTKEHKGNEIWAEDQRSWSKYSNGFDEYDEFDEYNDEYYQYATQSNYSQGRPFWSRKSGATYKSYPKKANNVNSTTTTAPKPTAQSVASRPYATFGSAATVKEEPGLKTSTSSSKRKQTAGTSISQQPYSTFGSAVKVKEEVLTPPAVTTASAGSKRRRGGPGNARSRKK